METNLPLTRVKKIAKISLTEANPSTTSKNLITSEAVNLLTIATEKYIQLLSKSAWNWTLASSRRTLQVVDIEQCIKRDWLFAILNEGLNNWPDNDKVDEEAEKDD
ncbi:unnamed protein product [Meloidogyne enterolobii]|uniref:Uncharacterized protein n=1 Tax=Meloidogyne enterolobii TaxID=390850 RepID=A0ACB0XSQ1_MELEN